MARMAIQLDTVPLRRNIRGMEQKLGDALAAAIDFQALRGVAYMKQTAPWTDDTGAARSGLFTVPSHNQDNTHHEILFSHSVDYGIWLEIAHSGRYQVIMPSVQHNGAEFMRNIRGLLDGLR